MAHKRVSQKGFPFSFFNNFISCFQKRQNKDVPCSSTNADADQQCSSVPLDQLPLNTLVIVASQLPFKDFKKVGSISKQFGKVSGEKF